MPNSVEISGLLVVSCIVPVVFIESNAPDEPEPPHAVIKFAMLRQRNNRFGIFSISGVRIFIVIILFKQCTGIIRCVSRWSRAKGECTAGEVTVLSGVPLVYSCLQNYVAVTFDLLGYSETVSKSSFLQTSRSAIRYVSFVD